MVKRLTIIVLIFLLYTTSGCIHKNRLDHVKDFWVAMHFLNYNCDADLEELEVELPVLARMGVNTIILEVDYHYHYKSHPELRQGETQISFDAARKFSKTCSDNGLRLFVEFQCLGHQSWAKQTFPLLTVYPHLDITPGEFPDNKDIYCREWDPDHPQVYQIILPMLDELIDAFQAEGIHVGMDETFLLGHEKSPTTKGKDPARLYARVVNRLHNHLVKKRKVKMLMWGDRLIDGHRYDYGEWEASKNGTAEAIDMIPRDIIICDWHYEVFEMGYPSVTLFLEKGFRVLPTSWKELDAGIQLIKYSFDHYQEGMLGHLFTAWGKYKKPSSYPPLLQGIKLFREAGIIK